MCANTTWSLAMKNGVKADERNQILHMVRNLSAALEGKMIEDVKAQTDPREMALWLIHRLEGITDALKVLVDKEQE